MWTFSRKLAVGSALSFLLLVTIGAVSYRSIDFLNRTRESVTHTYTVLERLSTLLGLLKDTETGQRGYVITGDGPFLEPYQKALPAISSVVQELRSLTVDNPQQQQRLDELEPVVTAKLQELNRVIDVRRTTGFDAAARVIRAGNGKRSMDTIRQIVSDMEREERDLLAQRAAEAEASANATRISILGGTLLAALVSLIVSYVIIRSVTQQIGAAVRHIESSSSELQAVVNQQVAGAKEQVVAMQQIAITSSELLETSRKIAEGSQRVAVVAEQTASAASTGEATVDKAQASVGQTQRQSDQIATYMAVLNQKSQQIGAVTDIVTELAEQTNILAINATIEAAGAGEQGKRFAVVADEIRKLADRVAGSTKEIRDLILAVRTAVQTMTSATKNGAEAVDDAARQFGDVVTALQSIADLVSVTHDSTREIELGTKQQTTAVEQVKIAISEIAEAARATEVSATQTLQTASELAELSRQLSRIIRPQVALK